jgi:hypothetical protein
LGVLEILNGPVFASSSASSAAFSAFLRAASSAFSATVSAFYTNI